ncbi:MAG: hypothetical protein LV479_13340 [Methylacidiphilales bacterium]|nr:hypothetical protein [Candidatus Methylacidiphilales bacterium]
MIEFTEDGPFAEKADQLFPGRVRIVGLGHTGAATCDQIVLHGPASQDLWVLDTDQQVIESSVVPNRLLLGGKLVHGLGCNGDTALAREIAVLEKNRLAPATRGCDFLILILGLAGSTGVALAEHLIEQAHEAGAKVIVAGVLPFAFEGSSRRQKAVEAMADLRRDADSVLVLSHDQLAENPATVKNIRHGFHLMHQLLAQATRALAQIVCKRGLIQLSFADVRSLYGRYAGSEVLENCWIAHVEGDLNDCIEDLIAELLESPLVTDEAVWKRIDHAIVAVSGTRDLGLSEVQEMVSALKDRLPVNIPIATSASLDEDNNNKVRMTVLLAMTAPAREAVETQPAPAKKSKPVSQTAPMPALKAEEIVELPATQPLPSPVKARPAQPASEPTKSKAAPAGPASSSTRPRRFIAKQEEMQFEAPTRGRFEKTHETMYRGENLDQPTFRRRGLKIKV